MPFKIIRHDITQMPVDAIVNAANTSLKMGGGVCGAIFSAAGADQLREECDRIGGCKVGEAVITSGYNLPARYIIHTAGPVWQGGSHEEQRLLQNSYTNSLNLALQHQLQSIAFPLISSGIYGYPKDQALQVAVSAIGEFLMKHDMTVYLVVFDQKAFVLSEKLFFAIEKFIDDNYVEEQQLHDRRRSYRAGVIQQIEEEALQESDVSFESCAPKALPAEYISKGKRSLEDIVGRLDETFSQMLLRLIDEKNMTDVETYKKANIDRKLFSKIRNNKDYNPSKPTAIAFAIALELNLDETLDFLGKAGYTLSRSNKFDVIIQYFIKEKNYNIFEINEALFAFDQALLGA